jgi:putative oxidoreductase
MIRRLFATDESTATAILRLVLGVVFFAHGAQLMLGWFGGYGFSGTMRFFTGALHIPAPLAFLAIAAEFFGGVGLILGLLTRIAAFGIAVSMLVAIVTVHAPFGFFMNWNGAQKGEGIEYHLLVLAMTVFLMIRGTRAERRRSLHQDSRVALATQPARNPRKLLKPAVGYADVHLLSLR